MKAETAEERAEVMADFWMVVVVIIAIAVIWFLAGDRLLAIQAQRDFMRDCQEDYTRPECVEMWRKANDEG
jgi:hypothetical protein